MHSLSLIEEKSMPKDILNQQRKTPCIAVITDDAPISEGILAKSMCYINAHLFKALDAHLGVIFATNAHSNDIEPDLLNKTVLINSPFIFKIFRKLARLLLGRRMCNAGFRLILPILVRKLKDVKAEWIFCPCGSNPFDLERGMLLARASQLPLAIFLVDDFIEGSKLAGLKEHLICATKDVPEWIRGADKVFVISEGFRERIKALYDKDATVLPFACDFEETIENKNLMPKDNQIIFVGNLSHFYIDGIKAMAKLLDELNQTRQIPFVLRLTLPDIRLVKKMVGDFKCIQCVPCQSWDNLNAEIAASLMAFVPYSFDPEYRVMTATSFPSKILSCLVAARYVLVYGPEESSSVRYFRQHGLPEVLSKDDAGALRDIVLQQINSKLDYSEKYRQVLRGVHDSKKVAQELLAGIEEVNK